MRKMISLLMALMMLCALLPVMAEGADLTGTWYLNALKVGETEINPATMGLEMSFELKDDGTGAISMAGEDAQSFTWTLKEDGTLAIAQNEDEMVFTVSEGRLEGDIGGGIGVFTREAPVAEAAPEHVAAESEDAFIGVWTLSKVDMEGNLLPADMLSAAGLELSATLTVEAGKASVVLNFLGTELPAIEGATTLTDGALAMTVEGLEDPIAISLCDNGELHAVISISALNTSMPMYFAPAE